MKFLLLPFVIVGRILFWAMMALAAWFCLRKLRRSQSRAAPPASLQAQAILPCDHCGLLLPEGEGVRVRDGFYCCEEHRLAGRR